MDYIVNLIIGTSTTLDVYVLVRLLVFYLILEFVSGLIHALGGMRR